MAERVKRLSITSVLLSFVINLLKGGEKIQVFDTALWEKQGFDAGRQWTDTLIDHQVIIKISWLGKNTDNFFNHYFPAAEKGNIFFESILLSKILRLVSSAVIVVSTSTCACWPARWGGGSGGSCRRRCCPPATRSCMNFGVAFLFIRSGKPPATNITSEWFFPRMGTNVGCEMVTSGKGAHADAALEGFLTRVNSNVTSELIWARKAPVAVGDGTSVGSLMQGGFAGTIGVLPGPHWYKSNGYCTLLVHLLIQREIWFNPVALIGMEKRRAIEKACAPYNNKKKFKVASL